MVVVVLITTITTTTNLLDWTTTKLHIWCHHVLRTGYFLFLYRSSIQKRPARGTHLSIHDNNNTLHYEYVPRKYYETPIHPFALFRFVSNKTNKTETMKIQGKDNYKMAYLNSILTTTISAENFVFVIVCSLLFVGFCCNEVPHNDAILIIGIFRFLFYFPVWFPTGTNVSVSGAVLLIDDTCLAWSWYHDDATMEEIQLLDRRRVFEPIGVRHAHKLLFRTGGIVFRNISYHPLDVHAFCCCLTTASPCDHGTRYPFRWFEMKTSGFEFVGGSFYLGSGEEKWRKWGVEGCIKKL